MSKGKTYRCKYCGLQVTHWPGSKRESIPCPCGGVMWEMYENPTQKEDHLEHRYPQAQATDQPPPPSLLHEVGSRAEMHAALTWNLATRARDLADRLLGCTPPTPSVAGAAIKGGAPASVLECIDHKLHEQSTANDYLAEQLLRLERL